MMCSLATPARGGRTTMRLALPEALAAINKMIKMALDIGKTYLVQGAFVGCVLPSRGVAGV